MTRRTASAMSLALLLAGCTAGPDYHVPDKAMINAPSAKAPFVSAQGTAFAQAPLPDKWWHLYNDPRLDGYVEEALAANASLRAADANLHRASEVVRQVKAGRTIQTNLTAEALGAHLGGYTETVPIGLDNAGLASVSIEYPVDLAGGIKRGIEAASDQAEAAQAARDQVRVTVAAAVTRSYADVCSANVTLAATRHVLDIQDRTLASMQRLFKGGRGTVFDVHRATTAADKSRAAIPEIIAERTASLFELAALMGRAPADYPHDLESCATPPSLEQPIPVGDGTALLKRRPDVRAAERQLAAATAGIGVQMAKLYPQVTLAGSMGLVNTFANLATSASFGGFAGPMVSWAFPNRKLIHAEIGEAGATADIASARFDETVIEALRQVETALTAYREDIQHDEALEDTRNDAAHSMRDADQLFRFGRTDVLNVLTAQAQLADAEATLAASRGKLIDRQINVFLSLGRGLGTGRHPERRWSGFRRSSKGRLLTARCARCHIAAVFLGIQTVFHTGVTREQREVERPNWTDIMFEIDAILAGADARTTATTQTPTVSGHGSWLGTALRLAGVLSAYLGVLGALFFAFDTLVGDPLIAVVICAIVAITAAPVLVGRPAGERR